MRIAILQPTYLPWIGYFEMIARVERYVAFDHVQFAKKSWQQRNRIKGPNGEVRLMVPVRSNGSQEVRIDAKRIDYAQRWRDKHVKSIEVAYRKARYFGRYFESLAAAFAPQYESVGALNLALIRWFLRQLGLGGREIVQSSILPLPDETPLDKTERVLNVCRATGATALYDGASAAEFLSVESFKAAGIDILFQHYEHPTYPQLHGAFLPFMSAIDLLMNCGDDSLAIILSAGDTKTDAAR